MTAARGNIQRSVHEGEVGVHSLDHFVLTVPDLKIAERFYSDFGLDVRNVHNGIELRTFGSDQCWGRAVEGLRKQLHHISFGCFAEDLPYFQERMEENGVEILDPPLGLESNGLWCRDPAGLADRSEGRAQGIAQPQDERKLVLLAGRRDGRLHPRQHTRGAAATAGAHARVHPRHRGDGIVLFARVRIAAVGRHRTRRVHAFDPWQRPPHPGLRAIGSARACTIAAGT